MTDQEKNEVLALAYGFTRPGGVTLGDWEPVVPDTPATAIFWRHKTTGEELTSQQIDTGTRWLYPDGTYQNAPPDFLHSLDAQAKWLWDKVRDMGRFNFVVAALVDAEYDGEHKAEACAEAILALIE